MVPLAFMDGMWRGPAWTILPSGEKHTVTQTERVGPFLSGSVKVVEGKGYEADGKVGFNAFATISFNTTTRAYTLHSYAQGQVGDFALKPTADGFVWEIPAGQMTIRYTAVIKDGTWHEVGDRIMPGKEPIRFFEMTLKRIGDTTWPSGGSVSPVINRRGTQAPMNGQHRQSVRAGVEVNIMLKKDQGSGKLTRGIVKDILTKSSFHPHGIKVRLVTGDVGRVQEVFDAVEE